MCSNNTIIFLLLQLVPLPSTVVPSLRLVLLLPGLSTLWSTVSHYCGLLCVTSLSDLWSPMVDPLTLSQQPILYSGNSQDESPDYIDSWAISSTNQLLLSNRWPSIFAWHEYGLSSWCPLGWLLVTALPPGYNSTSPRVPSGIILTWLIFQMNATC